jgi:hypothetical protein
MSDEALAPRRGPINQLLRIEVLYDLATRPAEIYRDRTLSAGSRRTMEQMLDVIAGILGEGKATARTCPWAAVTRL